MCRDRASQTRLSRDSILQPKIPSNQLHVRLLIRIVTKRLVCNSVFLKEEATNLDGSAEASG